MNVNIVTVLCSEVEKKNKVEVNWKFIEQEIPPISMTHQQVFVLYYRF